MNAGCFPNITQAMHFWQTRQTTHRMLLLLESNETCDSIGSVVRIMRHCPIELEPDIFLYICRHQLPLDGPGLSFLYCSMNSLNLLTISFGSSTFGICKEGTRTLQWPNAITCRCNSVYKCSVRTTVYSHTDNKK